MLEVGGAARPVHPGGSCATRFLQAGVAAPGPRARWPLVCFPSPAIRGFAFLGFHVGGITRGGLACGLPSPVHSTCRLGSPGDPAMTALQCVQRTACSRHPGSSYVRVLGCVTWSCVCARVPMYVHEYACTCVWVCACTHVLVCVHVCGHVCTCAHVGVAGCMWVCTRMCSYVRMAVNVHLCLHVHTCRLMGGCVRACTCVCVHVCCCLH